MVGDTYTKFESIANGGYLECKPSAGQEVVIHNIYHPSTIELKLVDGSGNEIAFLDESGKSFLTNMYLHLTEMQYLRVYNNSGSTMYLSVDGIITKDV